MKIEDTNHIILHANHCQLQQLKKSDFAEFDYIIGMDHENISDIKARAPKTHNATVELFGSYDPEKELIIRDPYYVSGDLACDNVTV